MTYNSIVLKMDLELEISWNRVHKLLFYVIMFTLSQYVNKTIRSTRELEKLESKIFDNVRFVCINTLNFNI